MKIGYDCQEMDCVFAKWQSDVTAKYPLTSNKVEGKVYCRAGHEGL